MPQYLEQRFNMDLSDAGSLAVLPYLIQIFTGIVGGRWTDQLIGRGNSVRAVRGGMSLFANMAPVQLPCAQSRPAFSPFPFPSSLSTPTLPPAPSLLLPLCDPRTLPTFLTFKTHRETLLVVIFIIIFCFGAAGLSS